MSSESPVETIVFDMDGTLIDSMPLVLEAFRYAVEPYAKCPSDEGILAMLGAPLGRTFTKFLGGTRHVPDTLLRFEDYTAQHQERILPFPGVHTMLQTLRERGLRLGLWTGRDRTGTEAMLKHHKLAGYFEAVVCGDDLSSHKPNPEGLALALRGCGETVPAKAILVGDADVDVLGGHALGVRTILIRHGRAIPAGIESQAWKAFEWPADVYVELVGLCSGLKMPR